MCDYSLHSVASRQAKVGDRLTTTRFENTITGGFSAIGEPRVAVCLRPGTEIAFESEIRRTPKGLLFSFFKKERPIPYKVARFRQINMNDPCKHHDALELPDGQTVLVTNLSVGQRVTVLQLPTEERKHAEENAAVSQAHITSRADAGS
jgi:ribosomal 50S subunit-recycling heat shock protein